jgi:hypothetical protein
VRFSDRIIADKLMAKLIEIKQYVARVHCVSSTLENAEGLHCATNMFGNPVLRDNSFWRAAHAKVFR